MFENLISSTYIAVYLTFIPEATHWYVHSAELAIIISYPKSASEVIALLKTPPK